MSSFLTQLQSKHQMLNKKMNLMPHKLKAKSKNYNLRNNEKLNKQLPQ
jgi:hypothetical protein